MEQLSFKCITLTDEEYKAVFDLRERLLRKPINLSLHDEDLSSEVNDYILIAKYQNELAACLILTPVADDTLQLRQMAVDEHWQGKNIGKQLVVFAEQYAKEKGCTKIVLHARIEAKPFYDKLGYTALGDVFTEVGIPHIKMIKNSL